jgi:DNA-binding IclR family transcriptional regulator
VLRRQLDQVRRSGVARSAQEHRIGVFSLAMPILTGSGPVTAVGLIAPLSGPRLSETLPALPNATAAIAASILSGRSS